MANTAGTDAKGGSSSDAGKGGGGASSGGTAGTFSMGGTFTTAGTFTMAGTFSTGGGGESAGGGGAGGVAMGGASGTGGAGGAGGGKAGAGGTGGAAGGKGGTGGTGGGGKCESVKLIVSGGATDTGNAQYPPSNAIDGDVTSRWASVQMVDDVYLQLDFGSPVMINHVNIVWEAAYATDYKLQVSSTANSGYVDIYENKAGKGGTEDITAPTLTAKAGQYLRMQGVTRVGGYGYSIYEITVSGDTDAGCTP